MSGSTLRLPSSAGGLTDVVPATSDGGATDPVSLEHADLPVALCVVGQGVRGHVADLHLVVIPLEVLELHPGLTNTVSVSPPNRDAPLYHIKHFTTDFDSKMVKSSKDSSMKQFYNFL